MCSCRDAAPSSWSTCSKSEPLASAVVQPSPRPPPPLPPAGTCRREDQGHALSFPSWQFRPSPPVHLQDVELPIGSTDATLGFLRVASQFSTCQAVFYFCSWSRWSCDHLIGWHHLSPSRLRA